MGNKMKAFIIKEQQELEDKINSPNKEDPMSQFLIEDGDFDIFEHLRAFKE